MVTYDCGYDSVQKVTITTSECPEGYEIVIKDDGIGFDYDNVNFVSRKHTGITNVKHRLKHLCDGSVAIESQPGAGTVVSILIPKK